jgi:ABC-2 type transport system permease protein
MQNKSETPFPIWTNFVLGIQQTLAIVEADIRKLRHDPYELLTRMIQPSIWLLIYGQAMEKARAISTGNLAYLDFMAPGILAQSVLFIAIFYGISLIWERDMGILHKILVTPAPRIILVLGRAIAAGLRSISQIFIVYLISYFLNVHLRMDFFSILGIIAMVMLGGAIFSTLSLIVACIVKKRERFMGIGQVLTMPLFFASNALYPLSMMPSWLQTLSAFNPLTYQVDALRSLMIVGEASHFGLWTDFGISFVVLALFLAIATPLYPKILY